MAGESCREWRGALASQALGRIDPDEAIGLRAHLDGCADCRTELQDLTAVARVLPAADGTRVHEDAPEPPGRLAGQVLERVAQERDRVRHRRRGRVVAGATALLAAAAIAGALLVATGGDEPGGTQVVFPEQDGARGDATLVAQTAGTEVELHVSGLRDDGYYWLWLTGDDGDRVGAGTFRGETGTGPVRMTAALRLDDARRIWVTDAEDRIVLDARVAP